METVLLLIDYLFPSLFLVTLLAGLLLNNQKWKIISLSFLVLALALVIIEIVLAPGARSYGLDFVISLPFSIIMRGTPLLVIVGIPMSLIIGTKKRNNRIKLISVGLLVLGLIWLLGLSYSLAGM